MTGSRVMIVGVVLSILSLGFTVAEAKGKDMEKSAASFAKLMDAEWKEVFQDSCTQNWKDNSLPKPLPRALTASRDTAL